LLGIGLVIDKKDRDLKSLIVVISIVGSITLLATGCYILGGIGLVIALGLIDSMNPGMY